MASISTQKASSSSTPNWKYDVFLSFRGEDTRNSFTDHIYTALKQKGIEVFRDEENLETGKSIAPALLKAIEESRFAVVILSRNYASSTWCLDELVKITECMKEKKMTIFPIFYDVNPSDVRKQTGTFAQAFAKHNEYFKDCIEMVQKWSFALREVANIKGWHTQDRPESKIIQNIVRDLLHKLTYASTKNNEDLVGITSRAEKLKICLALGSNDVRIIGIWGMGGIGKTTIARVVFRMVSNEFEAYCFLANVREVSERAGLVVLQQQLILQILKESMIIQDVDDGVLLIKNRLRHKRILLVLDDVNQLDQLNKLVGKHIWFGPGSRIILTTRDKHLLQTFGVDEIYEVDQLNADEALHLMSLKAFKKDHPPKDYLKLSKDFVYYAGGLPLAVEILGSFLFGRIIDEWNSALDRLKEFPEPKILQVLKISFDGLHEVEKEIFLHIACFFKQTNKNVVEILDYLGLYPKIGLRVLIDKSLIKVCEDYFWMHDLLHEMGKNIVSQECPKEPGKRSRLWLFKDIDDVLTNNMGTQAIEGMVLKLHKPKEAYWNPKSFSKIHHLKLLIIDNVHLLRAPKHLPNALRYLDWSGYPLKSFPSSFQHQPFEMLKFICLKQSLQLIETLNFNKIPNLEKLVLKGCINLLGLHPSIGVHKNLILLNLKGCKNLKSLPDKLEMVSLKILILSDCLKVKRIPKFGENMERVSELYLDATAITKLPTSIGNLTSLALLDVRDCKNLMSLPSTFFNMKSLKNLNFSGCSKLLESLWRIKESVEEPGASGILTRFKPRIPNSMCQLSTSLMGLGSLANLDLSSCNLNAIPNDICCLSSLEILNLSGNKFEYLPESISQLSALQLLNVADCMKLISLPKLPSSIRSIEAFDCPSLKAVTNLLKPNFLNLADCMKPISLPKLPSSICSIKAFDCPSLKAVTNLLEPNSLCELRLLLSNRCRLANNQGIIINMFFAVIRKHHQGPCFGYELGYAYDLIIPGNRIPRWFSHQTTGTKISLKVPIHLRDEWMGIAVCVVFVSTPPYNTNPIDRCSIFSFLTANGKKVRERVFRPGGIFMMDHIKLSYLLPELFDKEAMEQLWQCDVNGFSHIGIQISTQNIGLEVRSFGFRMVYKKDMEDLNQTMAQCANNSITPYQGLDVIRHNFDNSVISEEGKKVKRSRDDYDGAGPSGEGSSNNVPHPKRIERVPEFLAHGISDCDESSDSD